MHAGVVKSKNKKSDLNQAAKEYRESVLPAMATHKGNRSGMLLVNRETGDTISIAIYDDEATAKSFAPKAQKLMESFKKYQSGTAEPTRELYEIAASTQSETRDVVERGIKSFNAHDLEAVARDSAADLVSTAPGDTRLQGPQAYKEYNKAWLRAFPDAKIEVKNTIVAGKTAVVEAVFHGTHSGPLTTPMGEVPPTGRKIAGEFVQIVEVDRGLVKRIHLVFDQVDLMTQLGLAPTGTGAVAKTRS
jgi:predicted ester cyclase